MMEVNSSPTARFLVLAKTEIPIDSVTRVARNRKYDFKGIAAIELGFSQKYGPQLILVSYSKEGEYAQEITTDYPIDRARVEIPIPSALALRFLRDLQINTKEAVREVRAWERARGL